jgi:cell division protein FtsW
MEQEQKTIEIPEPKSDAEGQASEQSLAAAWHTLMAALRAPFYKGDKVIWRIIVALAVVSLLVIYSSTSSLAHREGSTAFAYFLKQLRFIGLSLMIVYGAHLVPIQWYRKCVRPLLIGSVGLMLLTFIPDIAVLINGVPRAINLFGIAFQPAELLKLSLVLYLAKVIEEGNIGRFKAFFWRILAPTGAICVLLIQRKCTSVALLLGFVAFVVLFVAKVRGSHLWKTAGIATVGIGLIVGLSYVTRGTEHPMFPRVANMIEKRVLPFLVPDANEEAQEEDSDRFQARQASIAIATGGLIPKGPGNSTQRHILPNAYDDYVYAVIVEEYGLVGALVVLLLYIILLYRAVVVARSCTRPFAMLAVLGLMLLIVLQAMLHMGVTTGILPVTGQTLPFISLGGSSLITTGLALGIILSISRATEERVTVPKRSEE